MCILVDAASKSRFRRSQKQRDSSMISQLMSSLVLSPKILRQAVMANQERCCGGKLLLTIDAHSDGVKK
jgi:hypothetical protein